MPFSRCDHCTWQPAAADLANPASNRVLQKLELMDKTSAYVYHRVVDGAVRPGAMYA